MATLNRKSGSRALPTAVKERLQSKPELPAKSKPWGKEWVGSESVRRNVSNDARVNNNPSRDSENRSATFSNTIKDSGEYYHDGVMAARDGYKIHKVKAGDNEYTNQHNPEFYEEITSPEGVTGFLERQNYLDRI